MNQISSNKATQADEELRTIFQQTLRGLEGDGVALLERSQMVWAQYREAEVEREGQIWNGGSIRPLMANLKYEAITRQRIAALASSSEGDSPPLLVDARAKTPLNLLEIIVPMVPQERVRGLLGAPTYTSGNRWQYRYEETQVEIAFNAAGAIEAVVVALCQGHQYAGTHPGENADAPLGLLTLADIIEHYPSAIEYSESQRTKEVYTRGRWGPPGAWTYYSCGALYVNTGVGHLQEVDFSWDKTSNQLVSEPKSVLINWMALMSSYGEPPGFDWFIKS
jgi:Lysozyme inhibitor LprI